MGVNVGQLLRQGGARHPERVAVVDCGHGGWQQSVGAQPARRRRATYGELDERAARVAGLLRGAGVARGDRVALCAENSLEFVSAWFGIVYCGAAVVPIPILSAPAELRYRVEHAACKAVLCDEARRELVARGIAELAPSPATIDIGAASGFEQSLPLAPADTAPGDVAMVLYTSGTTGKAKGAAITHASLMTHTLALCHDALGLTADDRVLGVLPLTHSYGCRMVMLVSFFAGARTVLCPRFDAARCMRLLDQEAVTWLPAVPTMYAALAAEAAGPKPGALRWALSAGAPLPDDVVRRAEDRLGVQVRQGYGLTEATFSTINAPPDERVVGSVGRPVWGVELRVVDASGADVAPGQHGEVLVRGHNTMSHYLHDAEASERAQSDGFVRSGDVGCLDSAGRLSIVDRIKDMILVGGNNVYPSEVEDALSEHSAVAQVAVVGRPDGYYGERVVAVVLVREGAGLTADELITWARERVARPKVPREVVFVDALPLGPSGKVLKRELRARLLDGHLQSTGATGVGKERQR